MPAHCLRLWRGLVGHVGRYEHCARPARYAGAAAVRGSPRFDEVPRRQHAHDAGVSRVELLCADSRQKKKRTIPSSADKCVVWAGLNGTPGAHRLPCHGHPPRERGRARHGVGRGAQPHSVMRAVAPPWILICAVLTPFSPHTGPRSRVVSWGATGCYPRAPTGVRRRRVPHGCVARGRTPHAGVTGRSARGIPPLVPSRGSPRLPPGACSVRHGGGARRTLAWCGRA